MRRALAALAVAALLAACGEETSGERVDAYLREANDVQDGSAEAFDRANRAYAAFSRGPKTKQDLGDELKRAETAIRATRARLAELDPPPDAAELHRRLLRLYRMNAGLAAETVELARYLPAAAGAVRPLERANRRLDRTLDARDPKAQARSLQRYAEDLGSVVADLDRLDPPPVLERSHAAQLRRNRDVRGLARELAKAVRGRDTAVTAKQVLKFRRARSRGTGDSTIERPIRGYERRYRAVRRAEASVQQARAELQERLF